MAVSFGDLKTRIKSDVNRPSNALDTAVEDSIRSAIRFYTGIRFYFLETRANVSLSSGSDTAALPDDFKGVIKLRLLKNSVYYTDGNGFDPVSYDTLLNNYTSSNTPTTPTQWAIFANALYFNSVADTSYTLDLSYIKGDVSLPSADGDTSVFFDEAQDLIRYKAEEFFYRDKLRAEELAQMVGSKAIEQYNSLIEKSGYLTKRMTMGGRLYGGVNA